MLEARDPQALVRALPGDELYQLIRDVAARLTQAGVPHALEPRTVEDPAAYVQTGWRELADFVAGIF